MKKIRGTQAIQHLLKGGKLYSCTKTFMYYFLSGDDIFICNTQTKQIYKSVMSIQCIGEFKWCVKDEDKIKEGDSEMSVEIKFKTIEELLKTEGVEFKDGEFSHPNGYRNFTLNMQKLCGESYNISQDKFGRYILNLPLGTVCVEKWMCSEWTEKNICKDKFNNFTPSTFKDSDGAELKIDINQYRPETFVSDSENIYILVKEDADMASIVLTFEQWDNLNKIVEEMKLLKSALIKEEE